MLLGPADLRALAARLGVRPTKALGQNFLHDPNTIRRIVRTAALRAGETVLEVGPGLGSLTLGLLAAGHPVVAVEIDPVLAAALPETAAARYPGGALTVVTADALRLSDVPDAPSALVANLPYNVAVPVVLHLLETVPSLERGLVLVQAEVAERLAAAPGSKAYGVPSAKVAWYAAASRAGAVPASVFWPVPNVESGLVRLIRRPPPATSANRSAVFAVIDAAFAQRRKTLRAALAGWAGSPAAAETALRAAGIDPRARGETLSIEDFARLAEARPRDLPAPGAS
jgi:16S rRNA (adenine1518-N6/adenine1519-N6)-dimethyltransferase